MQEDVIPTPQAAPDGLAEAARETPADFLRRVVFIGLGILLVALSYPDTGIGRLPLRVLLHDRLGVTPERMAFFFFLVNIPSWCKPILGIVADSFPLFGTHRRSYLLIGALAGMGLWLLMSVVPRTFWPLLAVGFALNAMCTIGGTINGAVVFEEGRKNSATGRLASVRSLCINTGSVIAGPVMGWLAERAFGWTCATGALLMVSLFLVGYFCLHERPGKRRPEVWSTAKVELGTLFRTGPLWAAAGLMFLVQVAPGFSTPLFYYQKERLGFSDQFIGNLAGFSSAAAFLGGALYFALCRRLRLRPLLALCIGIHVATTLAYLVYRTQPSAIAIEVLYGLGGTLAALPLFDLAARATPRGSEALGYSVLYAFINVAIGVSDVAGSKLFDLFGRHFQALVWVNAITTALVLLAIPYLPRALVNRRDGDAASAG